MSFVCRHWGAGSRFSLDTKLRSNNYSSMMNAEFRMSYTECWDVLRKRLVEPPPGRIQLLSGPRQVGKTTLLTELADHFAGVSIYAAADAPEAMLPGFWERLFGKAEELAGSQGRAIVLLDEAHVLHDWAVRLKGVTDHFRRRKIPVHVVATGSSALRLGVASRETLAGRFERLTLTHWSASSLAEVFDLGTEEAADLLVQMGSYPGAFPLRGDIPRWAAYVRQAILEPAIGRDILTLSAVRRPALLRQVFSVAATSPAQIISLQKLQGQLQDAGALETIAHYLALLEEAFLVAPIAKYARKVPRRRSSPPKLVTLNNALVSVMDPQGLAEPDSDPAKFGACVENACLAHAWNAGQHVSYWREEPLEVDGILEGSWGSWAVEVKTGPYQMADLKGLLEFVRRNRQFRPLVICRGPDRTVAERAGVDAMTWQEFLASGPAG
ncbi:MAG: AAA family ATPase [Candidatus Eisenbacteria bacterium]|nr:AAA family ATPase [Candidatus Eisenbacteria bacterium]